MDDLDAALRTMLHERAGDITTLPPALRQLPDTAEPPVRAHGRRTRWTVGAAAACVLLVAGLAATVGRDAVVGTGTRRPPPARARSRPVPRPAPARCGCRRPFPHHRPRRPPGLAHLDRPARTARLRGSRAHLRTGLPFARRAGPVGSRRARRLQRMRVGNGLRRRFRRRTLRPHALRRPVVVADGGARARGLPRAHDVARRPRPPRADARVADSLPDGGPWCRASRPMGSRPRRTPNRPERCVLRRRRSRSVTRLLQAHVPRLPADELCNRPLPPLRGIRPPRCA